MPKKEKTEKELQEIKELLKEILKKLDNLRVEKTEYHYHFSKDRQKIKYPWMDTGTYWGNSNI